MKKHLVLLINIVLVVAIVVAVVFIVFKATSSKDDVDKTEKESVSQTTYEEYSTFENTQTKPIKTYSIGVIQHSDIDNCNNVYKGISEEIVKYSQQGSFMIDYALEEVNEKCKEAVQRFIDDDVDLIVAIGPFAAKLASEMTTDIPVVFAAVQQPAREGLVDTNEVPGGNVTGVSDYTPCFEQIKSVKLMFPDCKKIGAIYNATDKNSVEQALMGKKEAERDEVNIPYEEYKVATEEGIREALDSMVDDGVEVIYVPADDYMNNKLDLIIDFSYEHNIPVICSNESMLDKGCFSTCAINYISIGNKVAEMVVDILVNSKDVSTLPVSYTNNSYLYINKDALDKLDVDIPYDVMKDAILK